MDRTTTPQPQPKTAVPLLQVGKDTRTNKLAGAIKGYALDTNPEGQRINSHIRARSIGAAAINQLIKGIALARRYLRSDRILPILVADTVNVTIEGLERTAIEIDIYFLPQQ